MNEDVDALLSRTDNLDVKTGVTVKLSNDVTCEIKTSPLFWTMGVVFSSSFSFINAKNEASTEAALFNLI